MIDIHNADQHGGDFLVNCATYGRAWCVALRQKGGVARFIPEGVCECGTSTPRDQRCCRLDGFDDTFDPHDVTDADGDNDNDDHEEAHEREGEGEEGNVCNDDNNDDDDGEDNSLPQVRCVQDSTPERLHHQLMIIPSDPAEEFRSRGLRHVPFHSSSLLVPRLLEPTSDAMSGTQRSFAPGTQTQCDDLEAEDEMDEEVVTEVESGDGGDDLVEDDETGDDNASFEL
ncbi:hypothetical protein MBLNU457_g0883t1 [Dothideomycetes sp. NU457]